MKSADIRRKFIEFYKARGHVEIPSESLVPENDPTTLFTSSGMQPLVPYLLGQPHPLGKRLVNSQKAFRAQDIDEVGDNCHTTFFEMLGNWSLGDYFKKEQLPWIWEFLTKELMLPKERLFVSVFEGDKDVPRDEESAQIWKKLGVPEEKIFYYDVTKNWWSRAGEPSKMPAGEPGGPDSEVFYEFTQVEHDSRFGKQCHPNCECGRFMEIANSVFMQYRKKEDGGLEELSKKSVDFGGGLERMTAATDNDPDMFKTDLFKPMIDTLLKYSGAEYEGKFQAHIRVIADHIKAAVFMIDAGVIPSNKDRGYILRRLIRRAVVKMMQLGVTPQQVLPALCEAVLRIYSGVYLQEGKSYSFHAEIGSEVGKFQNTLHTSTKKLQTNSEITPELLFDLKQSYGLPVEISFELLSEWGRPIQDVQQMNEEIQKLEIKHKDLSRTAAAGMFKGGLADHSEEVTKLHTATHLLHQALRTILGSHVSQKGSNITAERLRFDFSHPTKLTDDELRRISDLVNEKIQEDLHVSFGVMDKDQALSSGALAFFGERYGEKVKVYKIGDFSKEICGGPHVDKTGVLGSFKITKEESLGAGMRRIYATLSSSL